MWRMFGWLGKTIGAALLVSFLAIWTTGYIVNSYLETLLREYNLPLETRPFALSGLWGTLWGVDAGRDAGVIADGSILNEAEPSGTKDVPASASEDAYGDDADGLEGADGLPPGGEAVPDHPEYGSALPDDADQDDSGEAAPEEGGIGGTETGSGTGSEARGGAGQAGEALVTTEEMTAAKEQLSEDDRNKLFAILVSKLPQEEWQTISGYVEGGLTGTELMDVQQIVAKYLNDAEYDELMEILSKY